MLTDFEILPILEHAQSSTTTASFRWLSPELFASNQSIFNLLPFDRIYTRESDIWALGMTVFVRMHVSTENV